MTRILAATLALFAASGAQAQPQYPRYWSGYQSAPNPPQRELPQSNQHYWIGDDARLHRCNSYRYGSTTMTDCAR